MWEISLDDKYSNILQAVPEIMKEVFLCGADSSTGLPIPKV